MSKVIFFGVASNSFAQLNTVSFAVEIAGRWLLVDCGPDTPRQVRKAGINYLDISHIIITHRHLDHWLGLPYFLFGWNLEKLVKPETSAKLTVIAETTLYDNVKKLFEFAHPDAPGVIPSITHVDVAGLIQSPTTLDGMELQFFSMKHAVPTFGFKTIHAGGSLAYSSDTLPLQSFARSVRGVGTLIHEAMVPHSEINFAEKAMHSTAKHAGEIAQIVAAANTYLVHIRPQFWLRHTELEHEASSTAGMNIIFPTEGEFIIPSRS